MNLLAVLLVVLALLVLIYLCRRTLRLQDFFALKDTSPMPSGVDGLSYRVHQQHDSPQQAADLLASLNLRATRLMRWLRRKYGADTPNLAILSPDEVARYAARHRATSKLLARYNPDNLAENSPLDPSGDSSYTLDKGSVVALCLRNKQDNALHDLGTLTFVTLHEMTHIAIDDVDHPPQFWSAFRWVLDEAAAAGVYAAPDYRRAPVRYCGILIDHNPQYDGHTVSI